LRAATRCAVATVTAFEFCARDFSSNFVAELLVALARFWMVVVVSLAALINALRAVGSVLIVLALFRSAKALTRYF